MSKSLGILQIILPTITLGSTFNDMYSTDITSVLSKEEKENIQKALKGEKIVVVNLTGSITDTSNEKVNPSKFLTCYVDGDSIHMPTMLTINDALVNHCRIIYNSLDDEYYFFS